MPSSNSSMRHGSHDGHAEDLERHPSTAPLKLIAIPLYDDENTSHSTLESSSGLRAGGTPRMDENTAKFTAEHGSHDHHLHRPIYKRRTEANSTELFFDLFFVANLTVFTTQHEVDAGQSTSRCALRSCISTVQRSTLTRNLQH